jgi:pimeloyl-[acyl-carrier protein] methyl ester esterase
MKPLHVESSGSGRPLVFWHGWGLNLRVFDRLRNALAPEHRVIAVDLPGHGHSDWSEDENAELQLQRLSATVPDGALLIGWSLGGQMAMRYAARQRDQLRALILLHSTPRFVRTPDWPAGMEPETFARFATSLQRDPTGTVSDFLEMQTRGSRAAANTIDALQQALSEHGRARPPALQAGMRILMDGDLRAEAARLQLPTLVVGGQYDRITPPAASRALAQLIPGAQYLELRRAGHASFLSHESELLAALQAFMAGLDMSTAAPRQLLSERRA